MGYGGFSSVDYDSGVSKLRQTSQTFARSAAAASTGDYSNIADILNPRKLSNGFRECCYAKGFNDVLPIVVSIDGTGSMEQVPFLLQKDLPKLIGLVTDQNIADHPNVMFMCHDDEHVMEGAAFQMSQFEADAPKLLESLNEMVIPHCGGGNSGEAYHLPIYAAAIHTKLESFDRNGEKGFFFLIGDEEPYYGGKDGMKDGTSPDIAKELFGDSIEKEVTMAESLRKLSERYYVFIIRPGHTQNGKNNRITKLWQELLASAGINRENVLEIAETEAIVPTMALTIGSVLGADRDELVDVLTTQGVAGVQTALVATKNVAAVKNAVALVGKASGVLVTTKNASAGARRRR